MVLRYRRTNGKMQSEPPGFHAGLLDASWLSEEDQRIALSFFRSNEMAGTKYGAYFQMSFRGGGFIVRMEFKMPMAIMSMISAVPP